MVAIAATPSLKRPRNWQRLHRITVSTGVLLPLIGLIVAIGTALYSGLHWPFIALLVGMYVPMAFGITIGFHRYLTHEGFYAPPWLKFILLALGAMAIEGPPIEWVAVHRKHHEFSDKKGDPHSPLEGFWHAHVGWLFSDDKADINRYAPKLKDDRIVMFISNTFVFWIVLSLVIPGIIGHFMGSFWLGLLWGGGARICLTHHVSWSVNSVCHTFGSRPFNTREQSRNHWLVGLLAMGEGWHNNHHAFPTSALHGLKWWQFDASGLLIRLAAKLKVIRQMKQATGDDVARFIERQKLHLAEALVPIQAEANQPAPS